MTYADSGQCPSSQAEEGTAMNDAILIRDRALSLGYEKCGIISVDDVKGYKERLDERIAAFPESAAFYDQFYPFADVCKTFPWARSLIVCIYNYGKYKVPDSLRNRYGKAYLFDNRIYERSAEHKNRRELMTFLKDRGMQAGVSPEFGITSLRYAAQKAGLGIIRKNNFLFTEKGSWNMIDVLAVDAELRLVEEKEYEGCPDDCDKCFESCQSGALQSPFRMLPMNCVSFLTSLGGGTVDLVDNPLAERIGDWIYGCDSCQTSCPFNKGVSEEDKRYPGLMELTKHLLPENVAVMSQMTFEDEVQPKFWYLGPDMLWVWKVNALNVMKNRYEEKYLPLIKKCLEDKDPRVARMAKWVCDSLDI
jgi:epoxyqueuosine reductase